MDESRPDLAAVTAIEQRALRWSMAASGALSVMGVGWGIAASSQVILFDGVYGVLGLLLTWLAMIASRLVAGGATARYPFGREALAPLVIAVQGLALLGTCLYASIDAVLVIVDGGSDVSAGSAIVYAVISTVAVTGTWLFVRRRAHHSELLAAEAAQWMASAMLGAAMIVAFTAATVLSGGDGADAGRYVDPALVLVSCAFLVPTPIRMVRTTVVELLEGAPPPEIADPVRLAVHGVRREFGLEEPYLRMSKVGRKLYVEVDFLVEGGEWDVAAEDRIRRSLERRLAALPFDLWLNVELTGDPDWVT